MRFLLPLFGSVATAFGAPVDDFIAAAKAKHGAAGEKAAKFLVEHMPAKDKESLTVEFLSNHLDLAFQARAEFPWAKAVPEEIFLNDVLPYAVFDETREAWRADYLEKARPLVKDAKTASEAAQALNREFFKIVNVHYNTGRKMPNQSPAESAKLGMATCTGLSIILVDACRAVGIPARAVGTPMWTNDRGNHTWAEVWDDGWHFTGADEYDKEGLNRGWFVNDAAKAKADEPKYAIYATSWKKEGLAFPMVWAPASREVAAVNVTTRYAKAAPAAEVAKLALGVRLFDKKGGERVVAKVAVIAGGKVLGEAETKAGTTDLNDMPRFVLEPGTKGWLRFTVGEESREIALPAVEKGEPTVDAAWDEAVAVPPELAAVEAWLALPVAERKAGAPALQAALTKDLAARVAELLAVDRTARVAAERKDEMERKSLQLGDKTLRWLEKTFGGAPADGRSLWISMHGGGGAPPQVNDQQWQNQIRLYEPAEGIYIAPRAPTDTWNLWHEGHIDPMFQRLIENHVTLRGVNPNKVYLMGYSAGGDGVWQLAPRMADRFAAASMMAGHPNETQLSGLRNLPFAIFMGSADAAHNRNKVAVEKSAEMVELQKNDPGGYVHLSRIYEGLPHWMNRKDAEGVPWMAKFTRNPWPKKIVWLQDDITHDRFYWLKIPDKSAAKAGHKMVATVEGQTIHLEGDVPAMMELRLSDDLLDLDQAVKVIVNGKEVVSAKVTRNAAAIRQSLEERLDLPATGTAVVVLDHVPLRPAQTLPLWPEQAPVGDGTFERAEAMITVHRPATPNGTALVICPGGGYGGLVTGPEGHGIAKWLNGHGITGIVLGYRLPKGRPAVPLLDARRAIRTVRANAKDWGIDPAKVGIIGFSAGGHLAATAATRHDDGDPAATDPVERQGCRPDFAVLVYPVITMGESTHGGSRKNLLGPDPTAEAIALYSAEKQVAAKTSPTYLTHAVNDRIVPVSHSRSFHAALKEQQVPAEYLELPSGDHGLNGYKGPMWDAWQAGVLKWMAARGLAP